MKINKENHNWYGLDHSVVKRHFADLDGNLEYVGTFCLDDETHPTAVYLAPNPDTSKGHNKYLGLIKTSDAQWFVRGVSQEVLERNTIKMEVFVQNVMMCCTV